MIWPKSVKFPAPIPSTNVTLLTVFFALHRERCVGLLSVCISSIEEKVNVKKTKFQLRNVKPRNCGLFTKGFLELQRY